MGKVKNSFRGCMFVNLHMSWSCDMSVFRAMESLKSFVLRKGAVVLEEDMRKI